jgi:adenylate cyclase
MPVSPDPRAVVVEAEVDCVSDLPTLWRIVTNTEQLNRAIGLGRIALVPNRDQTAARYLVDTVSGGFGMSYEERPFELVENQHFSVTRVVRKGLALSLENTFKLAVSEGDAGTRLTLRVAVVPKYPLLSPIFRMQVRRIVRRMQREIARVDRQLAAGEPRAGFSIETSPVDLEELSRRADALRNRLGAEQTDLIDRLVEHVAQAPDPDVDRIRPFELADRWSLDRRAVLSACLGGVLDGLLELHWDLVCPSCRTSAERKPTLSELGREGHCQLCDISFELELDRAVEAVFSPPPRLRRVDSGPYCIGGPARTPHVVAQAILPAGGSAVLTAPDAPGRYRLFLRGGAVSTVEVVAGAQQQARLRAAGNSLAPSSLEIGPAGALVVEQSNGSERHAKLERLEYASLAATAHDVATLPAFRRQFATQVLRPGLTLRVARVALLFTDLTGSTALYSQVGDAQAFSVVQRHFELLERIVERHAGSIVKTIGDAVMAAFVQDAAAVRAAVAMQSAFPGFRSEHELARSVHLKIGVHSGACYVVTANGVLDYFGQVVNVAARLQGAAGPGEIVMTDALAREALGAGWLDEFAVDQQFDATLKGLAAPLRAARIVVDRVTARRDHSAPSRS